MFFNQATDIKLGTTQVIKVMQGNTQVWPITDYYKFTKITDVSQVNTNDTYTFVGWNLHYMLAANVSNALQDSDGDYLNVDNEHFWFPYESNPRLIPPYDNLGAFKLENSHLRTVPLDLPFQGSLVHITEIETGSDIVHLSFFSDADLLVPSFEKFNNGVVMKTTFKGNTYYLTQTYGKFALMTKEKSNTDALYLYKIELIK